MFHVTQAACVFGAQGATLCTLPCWSDDVCPFGSACLESVQVDGSVGAFCVPVAAGLPTACSCSANAVALQQKGPCKAPYLSSSTTQLCPSTQQCDQVDQPPACQPASPQTEVCNREDDDCDGVTDDGFCWVGATCLAAGVVAEVCNGFDDDCDGATDEGLCDDGDECTVDACNATTGGCAHAALDSSIACDDGNACTGDDHCQPGGCGGAAVLCGGKVATAQTCDPTTGCVGG